MAAELKRVASQEIDNHTQELNKIGEEIWKNPELGFKEFKAHDLLTDFLEKKGFTVQKSFLGIKTAFKATFGQGDKPNICVICEYDALPGIGHACGHNLIAEAGVAAGLGIKAALEANGAPKGSVIVMGTPAEEGFGGKVKLIDEGAFNDIDIAMIVHPSPHNAVAPIYLANAKFKVTFHGKEAHAAIAPWEGINALDAAVLTYSNISVLRQQLKPTIRIHGIISEGGVKPNIIPKKTVMEYFARALTREEVADLKSKVTSCFKAAAEATGCTVTIEQPYPSYDNVISSEVVSNLYKTNSENLGVKFVVLTEPGASSDMGNVSHIVPAIEPIYQVGDGTQNNHTEDFTKVTNTPTAFQNTLTAAKAMAMTAVDLYITPNLVQKAKDDLNKKLAS